MPTLDDLRSEETFEDLQFEGIDAHGFAFAGKELYRCVFRNVKLSESQWHRARFEDCSFEHCDLTQMVPGDARVHTVRFLNCKVMGVQWTAAARHPQLAFEDCDLRYASFVGASLCATSFLRCKATEATFIDVDLTDADFSGTDLTGATFQGTTLARANLSTASGAFIDPAKNRVKDVRVGVETAVLLAIAAGMRVSGYSEDPEPAPARGRRSRR